MRGARHTLLMTRLAFALALLLAGCSGETALREAPEPVPDRVGEPRFADPDSGAGSGNGGGAADSPWANLDPGDLPDTVFAVAWVDLTEGCVDCYYGPNAPDRYDLVDPLGQVLSSFELPFDWQDEYYPPPLLSLEASGPGRFIAANTLWSENQVVVWEGDAYTNTSRVLARIGMQSVSVPPLDLLHLLPGPLGLWDLRVLPDPTRPDAFLFVPMYSSPYMPDGLREIWSIPYGPGAEGLRSWPLAELSPVLAEAADYDGRVVTVHSSMGRLLLGTAAWIPDDAGGHTEAQVTAVSLYDEPELVTATIAPERMQDGARIVPDGLEQPAVLSTLGCAPSLSWSEGEDQTISPLPQGDLCPVLGPVLDAESRTFVYAAEGWDEEFPQAQRFVVRAGTTEVWSLERFRVGLSERPFHVQGVAAVER